MQGLLTDPTLGYMVEADWVRNQSLREVCGLDIQCIQRSVQAITPYGLITVDDDTTIEADLVIFAVAGLPRFGRRVGL